MNYPTIIQGGMGVGVSSWWLARAVSAAGQLGVVSGTGLNSVLIRRLQEGDEHSREALEHFPVPAIAERLIKRYFIAGGKAADAPYALSPMYSVRPSQELLDLTVAANFVEVWLAKHGHSGVVGINLLEKIQLPNLASLYGAILADVDYVLMGAGIPREIPAALDALALNEPARLRIAVDEAEESFELIFDPRTVVPELRAPLRRPLFLPIVASATLAISLARKATGRVDGFVVEGPTAGGHNAPPRGALQLSESGEPIYGPRDDVDLSKIRALGLPFWLAGSYATPEKVAAAQSYGAQGVQLGTIFALCSDSGISAELRAEALAKAHAESLTVRTDPVASPTGFPFKVAQLPGTMADAATYAGRTRICDLGYLRTPYQRPDGAIGYRCPAEPIDTFVAKGGDVAATEGRKCLCNGLMATIGLGQIQKTGVEIPLLTLGDDLAPALELSANGPYSARDVLAYLGCAVPEEAVA